MLKFCSTCDSPFKTRRFDSKYCQPRCNLGLDIKPHTCPNCKTTIAKPYSKETHACSQYCHQILTIADRIPINCPTCDIAFYAKPNQENKVFCSYDCRTKYKSLSQQERDAMHDIRVKAKKTLQKQHLEQLESFIKEINY